MKSYSAGTEELENILRRMREQQQRGSSGSKTDYSNSTNQAYKEWAENQRKYYNMKKDFPNARVREDPDLFIR